MGTPWKYKPTMATCPVCGKAFLCRMYPTRKQVTCSTACRVAFVKKNRKKRVECVCAVCGTKFLVKPYELKTRKYCSHSCASAATKSGSAAGAKRQARVRDGYACQFPGCTRVEVGLRNVSARMKIPLAAGGTYDPDNMVTLCTPHSLELERRLFARLVELAPALVRQAVTEVFEGLR